MDLENLLKRAGRFLRSAPKRALNAVGESLSIGHYLGSIPDYETFRGIIAEIKGGVNLTATADSFSELPPQYAARAETGEQAATYLDSLLAGLRQEHWKGKKLDSLSIDYGAYTKKGKGFFYVRAKDKGQILMTIEVRPESYGSLDLTSRIVDKAA